MAKVEQRDRLLRQTRDEDGIKLNFAKDTHFADLHLRTRHDDDQIRRMAAIISYRRGPLTDRTIDAILESHPAINTTDYGQYRNYLMNFASRTQHQMLSYFRQSIARCCGALWRP